MTKVQLTADKVTIQDEIVLNGYTATEISNSISDPSATESIVTEAAVIDYIKSYGWSTFTITSASSNNYQIVTTDTRLRKGMPIRFSTDSGSTWNYALIHTIAGNTYTIIGYPFPTGTTSVLCQIGDFTKVTQREIFFEHTPAISVSPSSSNGLLYFMGLHAHFLNISNPEYIIDVTAIFSDFSDTALQMDLKPYTSTDGSVWKPANNSNLHFTSGNSLQSYSDTNTMFSDYYVMDYRHYLDFYFGLSGGSAGVDNLQIIVTTITP